MTRIALHVRVKFRAFGMTFGTVERREERIIPCLLNGVPYQLFRFDQRGVFVSVTQEPVQPGNER